MFPSYRNQSANQLTGFFMMGILVVKGYHLTEATFKDVLKISFVPQFVNSHYKMHCKMIVLLTQILY